MIGGRGIFTCVRDRLGYGEPTTDQGGDDSTDRRVSTTHSTAMQVRLETGLTLPAYVQWLLRHNGGRMRQQEIVERTGWSEYTVSRVLTRMETDGRVERTRVGSEKLVMVPDSAANRAVEEPETGHNVEEPRR